jgi:dolichol-phosphate mannosyltransferase
MAVIASKNRTSRAPCLTEESMLESPRWPVIGGIAGWSARLDDSLRPNPDKKIACIVLPTYNEAESIARILPLIFREAENISTHELHVLVVDDNSPDGTGDLVRRAMGLYPCLHLISGEKRGLGEAYKRGIAHATANLAPELILQMDADFQHDPSLLPRLIKPSTEGYDVVIGSRFLLGSDIEGLAWHRKVISLSGTKLVRSFSGIPAVTDCTSGFRCIRAEAIARCDFSSSSGRGYSFQSWLLCELLKNGARFIEIPLPFPARLYGHSKLTLADKVEFVVGLFRLPRWKPARVNAGTATAKRTPTTSD